MIALTLKRISTTNRGTFGVLLYKGIPFAVTLELPWLDNQANISCIPSGNYICKRIQSPKFGETFEITDVPGRAHVLLHRGNKVEDTHGCVLVAEEFGKIGDETAILQSVKGYGELMDKAKGVDEFTLKIISAG